MKFANPAAFLEKKDAEGNKTPNIYKITNRTLEPDNEDGVKIEVPAERFVYPQIESYEEFVQLCGSEERAIEVLNNHLRDDALIEQKNRIRLASSGEIDDIIKAAIESGKNFNYVETAKVTAAEAKQAYSELRELASKSDLSDAELAALVRAKMGL